MSTRGDYARAARLWRNIIRHSEDPRCFTSCHWRATGDFAAAYNAKMRWPLPSKSDAKQRRLVEMGLQAQRRANRIAVFSATLAAVGIGFTAWTYAADRPRDSDLNLAVDTYFVEGAGPFLVYDLEGVNGLLDGSDSLRCGGQPDSATIGGLDLAFENSGDANIFVDDVAIRLTNPRNRTHADFVAVCASEGSDVPDEAFAELCPSGPVVAYAESWLEPDEPGGETYRYQATVEAHTRERLRFELSRPLTKAVDVVISYRNSVEGKVESLVPRSLPAYDLSDAIVLMSSQEGRRHFAAFRGKLIELDRGTVISSVDSIRNRIEADGLIAERLSASDEYSELLPPMSEQVYWYSGYFGDFVPTGYLPTDVCSKVVSL